MDEQWVNFWLVDSFTSQPFRGNPAGVVLEAEGLTTEQMMQVAREVGASETAFVFPPTADKMDLSLRWFTPTCEVPFCGHATLATLHVLTETGRVKPSGQLTIGTLSGRLKAWLCSHEEGHCVPMLQTPTPAFESSPIRREDLAEALLFSADNLHPDLPLLRDGTHLFVPLRRLETLLNLYPDFRLLSRLGLEHEVTGFACFTTETIEPTSHWHMRFFAPGVGVNEDPVTGAAQGPMAVYLLKQGILHAESGKTGAWCGEQGDALERTGRVQVELALDATGHVYQVSIGGCAVTVLRGQLRVV